MQTALSKSAGEGSTPDEATEAEIQAIEKDIAAIEVNIERTKKQIKAAEEAEKRGLQEPAPTPVKSLHQRLKLLSLPRVLALLNLRVQKSCHN